MNKKLNLYVGNFSKTFKTKLFLVNHLNFGLKKLNTKNFKKFLSELDVFLLSCIYKLTCLTKSVILSYFFITKKIDYKKLFELTNIENNFQQKRWGYVDEQKKIDLESIEILKNISIFFKNIN
jgi:chaperone required for assembly of F1-ATPase